MIFAVLKRKVIIVTATLVALLLISSLSLYFSGAYEVFYGAKLKELPIYYVKTEEKKIAISFDCAWGVDYTFKLLSAMEKEGVKCTFFTVKFWADKYPDYLKKIADAGHEIGTHSSTHPYMSKLDKNAVTRELESSCSVIESITGIKPTLFRPPYGDYNDQLIITAKEMGLYTIQWSIDSLDWKDLSAKEICNRVISRAHNGAIVLFHNQGLHTAEALPQILSELKGKGYTFVPIGELIYKDGYYMGADGAQIKNAV